MGDSLKDKASMLKRTEQLRLVGLPFSSLHEALWSTPRTCGRFSWWEKRGQPDVEDIHELLQ